MRSLRLLSSYWRRGSSGDARITRAAAVTVETLEQRRLLSTTLVSLNADGTDSGNLESSRPSISADGRYVVFISDASDLVANDNNGHADIFIRDLATNTTQLVTRAWTGNSAQSFADSWDVSASLQAVISGDGSKVIFTSDAHDIVHTPLSYIGTRQVYAYDVASGNIQLLSQRPDQGVNGDGDSYDPVVSHNGRYVAYASDASNLVGGVTDWIDTNGQTDVYVYDLVAGGNTLVSRSVQSDTNDYVSGNGASFSPVISADGSTVAFVSTATDLTAGVSGGQHVYVYELSNSALQLVSVKHGTTDSATGASFKPAISADGSKVAFISLASDLVAAGRDTNGTIDVYHRNVTTGVSTLVSVATDNNAGNGPSGVTHLEAAGPFISADGTRVVFASAATNLSNHPDTNGSLWDTFVRDVSTGTTTLVSVAENPAFASTPSGDTVPVAISSDATRILMRSTADDVLIGVDDNGFEDLYLRNTTTGQTTLISATPDGTAGDGITWEHAAMTGDGTAIAFASDSMNLVATDNNWATDVFVVSSGAPAPVNSAPIAASDAAVTTEDHPVTINVLANDVDPDGDPLTIIAVTQGQFGSVTTNADNTITYLPALDFIGTDSFTYTISDGRGGSATATVYITVLSPSEKATLIAQEIEQLRADGKLTSRQAALMQNRLGQVVHFLSRPNPSLALALDRRDEFVQLAQSLLPADRDPLVSGIDEVMTALTT